MDCNAICGLLLGLLAGLGKLNIDSSSSTHMATVAESHCVRSHMVQMNNKQVAYVSKLT